MRIRLFDRLRAARPNGETVRRLLGDAMWVLLGAVVAVVVVVIGLCVVMNAFIEQTRGM
ncbi:hypothetical protein [Nocardia sp. NBC_00511]|uniref:hypothetical protein n=1 Tax=Nocardia sp. NBC_00511 TaxID=2903591 RepID=UPI0030E3C687